jgi:tetratricopeptide (TPR) repeat protein
LVRKLRPVSSCLCVFGVALVLVQLPLRHENSEASASALFSAGSSHYQKGDFASAERVYRQLLDSGVESGTVYYNLGNACFKQRKLGEAIYFWEEARQRLASDREVKENLELANLLVVDRIEEPAEPAVFRLLGSAIHALTIRQYSWVILVLFVAANILLGIRSLTRNPRTGFLCLTGSIASAVLLLLFGGSLGWRIYEANNLRHGIVVEQKVDIRSGPGGQNVTVFTVHEGTKVRIRGDAAGWYQVSLANGWVGWLEKSSVRVL